MKNTFEDKIKNLSQDEDGKKDPFVSRICLLLFIIISYLMPRQMLIHFFIIIQGKNKSNITDFSVCATK